MTPHGDILIGRIALERGLVSPDQLADCLNDQKGAPASSLGTIMLRKGLIKQRDLDSLIEEQKKRLAEVLDLSDPKLEDALLGRLLIKQGLIKETQLYECLRASAEAGEAGEKSPRLGELLVKKGFLSPDAADRTPHPHTSRRETLVCHSCGAQFSTLSTEGTSKKHICKQCGAELEQKKKPVKMGETTEAVKVDLPEDAAKVKKDPARQFAGGKYILVQEVGRGGMGVVWKAWQTDLKRYVAVKILIGTMWTDVELKRFYREAQMAASLSHPNIASIYEVGAFEGKHYMVMEFVDGDSLARLMTPTTHKAGTTRTVKHLPPRRAIEILHEVSNAVDYAHSKKIIHRDLKPHNIMVQKADGRVFVMDFGLAKPIKSQESITISDAIVGTPQYMSPEQARGDTVDRRTDVYSLGAVLYHVLTGKPPFEGHSPGEIMMSVLADDPVPLRKLNSRIHADVETITLKALDKDRSRRYGDAKSLAEDLGRYLEGEPISARPLSRREKTWKEIRRSPVRSVIAAAAVAALLLVGTVIGIQEFRQSTKLEEFARLAHEAHRAGRYSEAKSWWEKILGHDEDNEEARRGWERANDRSQDPARELDRFNKFRDQFIARGHRDADTHMKGERYQEALTLINQILAFDANDTEAQQKRDRCLEELQEDDLQRLKALEDLARAQKDKDDREAEMRRQRINRINAFTYYKRAHMLVEDAIKMRLQDASGVGFTIGDVKEKYQEARDALTKALEIDATYAEALSYRGSVRHRMGEFELAELDYKDALAYSSDTGPAAFGAAMSQLALYMLHTHTLPDVRDSKAQEVARERLRGWAEKAENAQSAFERWGAKALLDFNRGLLPAAEEKIRTVEREGRGNPFYHFVLACIHIETGNWRAADQELGRALEMEPTSLESRFLRSVVKVHTEDLTNAAEDAMKAVEMAPTAGSSGTYLAYLLRAHVYHEQQKLGPAVADLGKAGALAKHMAAAINSLQNRWLKAPRPSEK